MPTTLLEERDDVVLLVFGDECLFETAKAVDGLLAQMGQQGVAFPGIVSLLRDLRLTCFPKRANLLEHCPAHARRELRRDYNRIVYAKNGIDARKAYDELVAKWTPLTPTVVRSLEEAGNQLLTFYEFPRVMWKSIRTTNALENLNREFRRRTKTQASFSSEESAVALLFGLIASGQIQLRRIDGYQRLSEVLEHAEVAA